MLLTSLQVPLLTALQILRQHRVFLLNAANVSHECVHLHRALSQPAGPM